jgi:hypothetical protein
MGLTEKLARASAGRPRRTFALWGVAVVVAVALIATSLHGLSSNGNVVGNPESTKAKDTIAKAFPAVVASEQQDVIVITSQRYAINGPRFRAFAKRYFAELRATGEVRDIRVVAVSPPSNSALVSVQITSDSGAHAV